MAQKLAVFDVDGTLVDSRALITECCQEALTRIGLAEPDYDTVRRIVGLGLREALAVLAPDLPEPDLDRLVEFYRNAFFDRQARPDFHEPLYAGAAEALARLKDAGWRVAVATGKSRRGLERIVAMHGWAEIFHSTHCDDDGPGKPHPAMLLAAMEASGVGPADTVMIGDTSHDMRMARAAGAYAQGVAWGFHTAEEMAQAGAHHIAFDFAELDLALDRFAGLEAARA